MPTALVWPFVITCSHSTTKAPGIGRGLLTSVRWTAVRSRLQSRSLPSPLECGAVGLTEHLKRFGLRIPGDVSVIAYDEMPLAAHLDPPANDRFAPGPLT